eukprot:656036-Pleurochrysis_carterae.AAC.1
MEAGDRQGAPINEVERGEAGFKEGRRDSRRWEGSVWTTGTGQGGFWVLEKAFGATSTDQGVALTGSPQEFHAAPLR